jgi:Excisionase from transposon Tn916.
MFSSFFERRLLIMQIESILLNVEETASYLHIGKTKTRELFKKYDRVFVIHIGNRSYAHKVLLDKWLLAQVKLTK